jgi:hypothetical protein
VGLSGVAVDGGGVGGDLQQGPVNRNALRCDAVSGSDLVGGIDEEGAGPAGPAVAAHHRGDAAARVGEGEGVSSRRTGSRSTGRCGRPTSPSAPAATPEATATEAEPTPRGRNPSGSGPSPLPVPVR